MLKRTKGDRSLKENLLLASSTALVAGATNISGVIAFLAYSTSMTGHFANLAKNVIERNLPEVIVLLIWLLLFFAGAFAANFLVRWQSHKSVYRANALPIVLEIIILLLVAFYGRNYYAETLQEKQLITSGIILAMGLQNGMVANISGGLIRTAHLTGMFTELGADAAEWVYKSKRSAVLRNRMFIRYTVLGFYFLGALAGGYLFDKYDFALFYFIPVILMLILYYDLSPIALHKLTRLFSIK